MEPFKSYVVRANENNVVTHQIEEVTESFLGEGNTLIAVEYSSINYKDMLGMETKGGVIRTYPMIPGIDLAGTIISSEDPSFKPGDRVLVTGYKLGTEHTGGFSEVARVPSEWVVKLPENLSTKEAMMYGTAGFTAALSIAALEKNGMRVEEQPEILITGATGGVGSVAAQILRKLGYKNITATIRKDYQAEKAKAFGATKIWDINEVTSNGRPLNRREFKYVVDAVGGDLTADILSKVDEYGSVAISGNAGGIKLNTTVLPFILRGVNLLGINSVSTDMKERQFLWNKLANEWNVTEELHYNEIALDEVSETATKIKAGAHLGRTIIKIK
ncbi:acrylyl-CoA reductase family protein [Jeotgalibaca sp. A127]|uniref:acrylyl-CoA reductase family protein n=1 Tax=Jeotgalibaca sp. A127 TaxID=3457324 RepID=UPI003FD508E8